MELQALINEQQKAKKVYEDYLLVKQAEGDNHGIWDIAVELYKLDYAIKLLQSLLSPTLPAS